MSAAGQSAAGQNAAGQAPAKAHDPFTGPLLMSRIPLTESQREVWLATQMQPEGNLAYNEGLSLALRGELDIEALRRALQGLLDRHDILRATISPDSRWLCIRQHLPLDLPITGPGGTGGQDEWTAAGTEEMRRPFDLQQGPLIRFRLVAVSPTEHQLLIIAHHIIVDGWSAAVLLTELGTLYSAFACGDTPDLPVAPHYGDYADSERAFIASPAGAAHASFWLELLRDAPLPPELPLDRPRPVLRTYSANRLDRVLDADLVAGIRRLGADSGASLVATTLAAFAVLLRRVTGTDDLVIGLAASGQSFHGAEQLVGHCVNFLPLRFRPAGSQTFVEFLGAAQQQLLDAFEHQGATFGSLLPRLTIKRDPQRPPLVSVVFNLDVRDDELRFAGLDATYSTLARQSETFELYLNLVSNGDGMVVECSYNSDLFSPGMVEARLEEFETLLRSACADPRRTLDALPLLSPVRQQQIVHGWNDTRRDYSLDTTVTELISAAAGRWPEQPALVSGADVLTYRQLEQRATALAHVLITRGVGPDTIVGVCANRSAEMVIALLGILKAGGAYLPLDPEYPAERLDYMVDDASCPLILAGPDLGEAASRWLGASGREVLAVRDLPATRSPGAGEPGVRARPDSLVYVLFTSGSTGRPKGTLLTHRGVVNRLLWGQENYPIGPGDRLLQKTPYSFDVSVPEFFWTLMTGATLVMARPDGHKDPAYLVDIIQRERITSCHFVPSMLGPFLDHPGAAGCRSLRHVFASGEALPYSQARRLHATLPQAQLHNLYGPTEASVEVSYWDCPAAPDPRQLVPIGRPVANTTLYVLDAQGEPLPVGVPGELHLGGVQLARGYLNQPGLTAERFIEHAGFGRLYRTGDLARWLPDGVVDFLGRADGQVKLRGFRIELGEIESRLKALPQVTEAVAALRERSPGDARLVAWVAARPGEECNPGQLATALAVHLPEHMIPQVFVPVADFPRLISGKINRAALPDPSISRGTARNDQEPPQPGVEVALAELWREILGQAEVGRADRFLDLGGHSLLAVRLAGRIEQQFGVRPPLRSVMMESLAGLARQLPGGQVRGSQLQGAAGAYPAADDHGPRNDAFFFGPAERQLFGVLSIPAERRRQTAVLVCASWGPEYMRAHRALHLFSEGLAQAGYATLRFDYAATGDSAGYSIEAGLDEWLDNIATAAAELRRRSGAAELCIVGLRLGALLGGQAVARGLDAKRLVLWDPPADGRAWLAGLREFDRSAHEKLNNQRAPHMRLPPAPGNQLLGIPITEEFQSAIEGLGLQPDAGTRATAVAQLLVLSADVRPVPGIAEVLELPGPGHWAQLSWLNTPWNPATAIQTVVRKLETLLP